MCGHLLIWLTTVAVVLAQDPPSEDQATPVTYDYIVRFTLNMDETKVPQYIVSGIYGNRFGDNVTVSDILELYKIRQQSLDQASAVLESLNVSPSTVFSIHTFEAALRELHLDFTTVYSNIFILNFGAAGPPLKRFLDILGVDLAEFSSAMVLGISDPLEVFKRGNFAALEPALQELGKTPNDLYKACIEIFAQAASKIEPRDFVSVLKKYSVSERTMLRLWEIIGITIRDIYLVDNLNRLLLGKNMELRKEALGVVIGGNNIVTDKTVGNFLKDAKQISVIRANTLDGATELKDIKHGYSNFESLTVLGFKADTNVTFISYDVLDPTIVNCTFVTLKNNTVVAESVVPIDNDNYIEIESVLLPYGQVTPGSPLICHNVVYGLAQGIRNKTSGRILLDNFKVFTSKANILNSHTLLLLAGLLVFTINL